jgi:hypothetical protein
LQIPGLPVQKTFVGQLPQAIEPPQPSGAVPHWAPAQA